MLLKSIMPALVMLFAIYPFNNTQSAFALDNTGYCNAVQNKVGLIRYPLGTIGVSSTSAGEIADVMTLAPRVYPCIGSVVVRPQTEDWRASIGGDPSMLTVKYKADKPSGAATAAITVTPHVSVFKVTFPEGSQNKYVVLDFGKYRVDSWAELYKWTQRKVTRIDDSTVQATVGPPGGSGAYYTIKFSVPSTGSGTFDASGAITDGAGTVTGARLGMYAQFDASTITVAVAESFTSMDEAGRFLASEFTDFDTVQKRCRTAWNGVLNRVEIEGSENSKRMAYTSLYSMYVNIIDGGSGSCYSKYYPRPRSLSSSAYWQFIGGFQSCCWDNFRTAYPFLMLGYPEVMSDIVNTYLARYQRDGFVNGNICLFSGPTGEHSNIRLCPVLIAEAYHSGVQAEYSKLYAALKDNFGNEDCLPASFGKLGYLTQPASGGKACSQTLEWATGAHSMAMLAKANNDPEQMRKYLHLSRNYKNIWDGENKVFRVKNTDGTWGVIDNKSWTWNPNPQGLFEGTNKDWMFFVPHDPYGLINLPGQQHLVDRVVDYCLNDTWFNDFQYHYPYLLYYAGAANEGQKIIRNVWVPLFKDGVLYEGVKPKPPHNGWKTHYTSNAAWLICSMLGLYPVSSPPGQYIISSPSIEKAVIHCGEKTISVQTKNNTGDNIYIRSIKVDGEVYPCYMIPARRLISGVKIELEMGSDPAEGLGGLYIASSDGFVLNAEMVSASHLRCTIESAITDSTTKIYSWTKPVKVTVNGRQDDNWDYDETNRTVTVQSTGTAAIEVLSM